MSIAGILAGTDVEVCGVERQADGDLLVSLVTHPPTWVFMRAGDSADELERTYGGRRVTIPMPPQTALMGERPTPAVTHEED
jgi:hypothetical protein